MARKSSKIKSFKSLWESHEKRYYNIFLEALKRLEVDDEKCGHEDAISEALCLVLRQVCCDLKGEIHLPVWEQPIQPVTDEELKGGKKRKRPDFTCNLINSNPTSIEDYSTPFHIECKRLGLKSNSNNLNQNYVNKGLKRFDSSEHEYGKRASSGMMIGYIVSSEPDSILEVINKELPEQFSPLNFTFTDKVTSCEQKITRIEVAPKSFKLIHLWANLKTPPSH